MSPERGVEVAKIDRDGFRAPSAMYRPFPPQVEIQDFGGQGFLIWDPERLRFASIDRREITTVPLPRPGPVFGVGWAWAHVGSGSVRVVAVALTDAVAIYDEDNRHLIATLPYYRDVHRWGTLRVGINSHLDRFYFWHSASPRILAAAGGNLPSYIDVLDAKGNRVHSYTLPPLPLWSRPYSRSMLLADLLRSPVLYVADRIHAYWTPIGSDLSRRWPASVLAAHCARFIPPKLAAGWMILVSTAFAALTFWQARHFCLSRERAWKWAGVAFAFNLAGFLMFRLVTEPPIRVACLKCGGARSVDQEQCPHCHSTWLANVPDGTEIFESTAAAL